MKPDFYKAIIKFIHLLRLDKVDIVAIYWLAAMSGLIYLVLPLGIQAIVSFVMAGSISTSIIVLITLVVCSTLLNGYLQIKQLDSIEKIEQKIFVRYAFAYTQCLPLIDLQKTDSYYLPEMVNRFFDISSLQKGIFKLLMEVPLAVLQILIGTILLSFYHPIFIGFGLTLFILIFFIIRYTSYMGFDSSIKTSDQKYRIGDWLEQISRNIKIFKYNNFDDFHLQRTDEYVSTYIDEKTKHYRILKIQYWSMIAFKVIILLGMLLLGISLLVEQEINIGQFIAADIIILGIISSTEKFIQNFDKLYECLTALEKLEKITEAPKEESGRVLYSNSDQGMNIRFEKVTFSYNESNPILKDLTFEVKNGEWLQIMGERKSGKTSIINLISGAYQEYKGNILINDLPLKNYDLTSLRKQTGLHLQDNFLVEGTIMQNICLSNHLPNTSEIVELSKLSGLWKFISNEKDGFELKVHPYRRTLPAAFINSILLTRALYRKPDLLLLEDPFMGLSEDCIVALRTYLTGKNYAPTVIIVNNENKPLPDCHYTLNI